MLYRTAVIDKGRGACDRPCTARVTACRSRPRPGRPRQEEVLSERSCCCDRRRVCNGSWSSWRARCRRSRRICSPLVERRLAAVEQRSLSRRSLHDYWPAVTCYNLRRCCSWKSKHRCGRQADYAIHDRYASDTRSSTCYFELAVIMVLHERPGTRESPQGCSLCGPAMAHCCHVPCRIDRLRLRHADWRGARPSLFGRSLSCLCGSHSPSLRTRARRGHGALHEPRCYFNRDIRRTPAAHRPAERRAFAPG